MYLSYFGLKRQPFKITPDTSLFFAGAERGGVLDAIMYALNSGEGIVKVVGEVGSGKTMLSRMLTRNPDDKTEFVYLLNPRLKAEQALFAIAYDLGLVVDAGDKSIQILHVLQRKLLDLYQAGRKVVLIVDEAQQMPLSTLEEIRLLSNLETETEKLLQIILFGQPELDEHLDTPKVRQLRERITYSFYLTALDWKKADSYIHFRLKKAGHEGRTIFKQNAIKLLAKRSEGTLRRMNVLADKALLAAFLDKSPVVEPKHIRLAIKDSQKSNMRYKLPSPALSLIVFFVLCCAAYWFIYKTEYRALVGLGHEIVNEVETVEFLSVPEDRKVVKKTVLEQRILAYEKWRKQSKGMYTVQIFSANKATELELNQYLKDVVKYIDLNKVFVRKIADKHGGYIVYYQSFNNFSDASKAINQLPNRIKKYKPYVNLI
jgi:MSHA biogenesis protein MshM